MERIDAVVAGAGVVGLAVARALALSGREVLVLEAESAIGTATSSRNSEVIHAGIYYPPEYLKTRLCVDGRAALYRYCEDRGVEYRRTGKLILATSEGEIPRLAQLQRQAAANGIPLQWIDAEAVLEMEPQVHCVAGLWSTETGILDSHALMLALQGDFEAAGGMVLLNSPVMRVDRAGPLFELEVGADGDRLACEIFVNSAGLESQELASRMSFLPPETIPVGRLVKGHYFYLSGPVPFRHLVYPLPVKAGLGIHVTLDMAGQARFGPDAVPVDGIDYDFDEYGNGYWAGEFPEGLSVAVDDIYVSFESNGCIKIGDGYFMVGAVIVKGSDHANVYYYEGGTIADEGLTAPGEKNYYTTIGINILGIIPRSRLLSSPTIGEVLDATSGRLLTEDLEDSKDNIIENFIIGAMQTNDAIKYMRKSPNLGIITGGDRSDLILMSIELGVSLIVLTGNLEPGVVALAKAKEAGIPIILVNTDTYTTARNIQNINTKIQQGEIEECKTQILNHVKWKSIFEE